MKKRLKTLIQRYRIYIEDTVMEFCIEKWVLLIKKSGKQLIEEGIELEIYNVSTDDEENTNQGEIYGSLIKRGLFPKEQKRCLKGTRRTLINKYSTIAKRDEKRQALAWIDCKRASDMVPQSWIIDCLTMNKISDEVVYW